jgi:hypothetical protein
VGMGEVLNVEEIRETDKTIGRGRGEISRRRGAEKKCGLQNGGNRVE